MKRSMWMYFVIEVQSCINTPSEHDIEVLVQVKQGNYVMRCGMDIPQTATVTWLLKHPFEDLS